MEPQIAAHSWRNYAANLVTPNHHLRYRNFSWPTQTNIPIAFTHLQRSGSVRECPGVSLWPMPTCINSGNCIVACFINCSAAAAKSPAIISVFKNKLLSLDATPIELSASVFEWAQCRRTKGPRSRISLLDHQGLLPSFAAIAEGCVHESRCRRMVVRPPIGKNEYPELISPPSTHRKEMLPKAVTKWTGSC